MPPCRRAARAHSTSRQLFDAGAGVEPEHEYDSQSGATVSAEIGDLQAESRKRAGVTIATLSDSR